MRPVPLASGLPSLLLRDLDDAGIQSSGQSDERGIAVSRDLRQLSQKLHKLHSSVSH